MIFFFRAVNTSAPYRKSLWVCGKRHVETHMLPLDNEGGNEQLSPCPVSAACGEAYGTVM